MMGGSRDQAQEPAPRHVERKVEGEVFRDLPHHGFWASFRSGSSNDSITLP